MQTDQSKSKRHELAERLTALADSVKKGGTMAMTNQALSEVALAADEIAELEFED